VSLSFLTPAAGLVGLLGVLAVLVLRRVARRSDDLCGRLELPADGRRRALRESVPLVAIAALLGLAATQPVLSRREAREGREGVEVITIMDITRSMLARRSSTEPTRLERGRTVSKQVRAELADLPFGVASVTDRVLPHLFPSLGVNSFTATIDRAIGIDRPPPDRTARRAPSTRSRSSGACTSSVRRRRGGSRSSSPTARRCQSAISAPSGSGSSTVASR
jgi:hypothetical protein